MSLAMDSILEEISDVSVPKVVKWFCSGVMIFGGVVPYIPQYREIKRTEDADGFSLFVCLALLIANTLRILFWFGKRYELPLLIQSVIMNIAMFAMVHLCVQVKNKTLIIRGRDRVFSDLDRRYFWAWTDFTSYVDFMLIFTVVCSVLMYLMVDVIIFVELVGFLALLTEACLGAPQLLHNHNNKSTEGMSIKMVFMWSCGDVFKTCYFVVREAPMQFWICGTLQVCIDMVILLQVYWYRHNVSIRTKKQDTPD